jgi:hypothetical protein
MDALREAEQKSLALANAAIERRDARIADLEESLERLLSLELPDCGAVRTARKVLKGTKDVMVKNLKVGDTLVGDHAGRVYGFSTGNSREETVVEYTDETGRDKSLRCSLSEFVTISR